MTTRTSRIRPSSTVRESREAVRKDVKDGVRVSCPTCGHGCAQDHRHIYYRMAQALTRIYLYDVWARANNQERDLHIGRYLSRWGDTSSRGGDVVKLAWRFWELLHKTPGRNGYYRISKGGRAFVEGRLRVPYELCRYKGEVWVPDRTAKVGIDNIMEDFDQVKFVQRADRWRNSVTLRAPAPSKGRDR